jgi:hypothetical protein
MNIRNIFAVSALCVLLLGTASCITRVQQAPAGAMATNEKYTLTGNYSATLGAGLFTSNGAVTQAARNLRLVELSRINKQQEISYEYKDVYETRIDVTLTALSADTSRIVIKQGKTGNRSFSKNFLDNIIEDLNARTGNGAAL